MNCLGSGVRELWYSMKSGLHHGKAGKFTRRGDHESALQHFLIALESARIGLKEGEVAIELECVARSLYRLNRPNEGRKYAEEAMGLYKMMSKNPEDIYFQGVKRIEALFSKGYID